MLYHTVHSQLSRIRQTYFAHSALKRCKRYFIMTIFTSQHSILIPKNRSISPRLYNSSDAYKLLRLNQRMQNHFGVDERIKVKIDAEIRKSS
jgi:hypothetical protein